MRFSISFWAIIAIVTTSFFSKAQPLNINVLTDSVWVTGPWSESRDLVFANKRPVYSSFISRFGVQFKNGITNTVTNNVSISNLQGSPIIGTSGIGTRVDFNGNFKADEGQSQASIAVLDNGHFYVGANCRMDLILPSYFTRQIWVYGDGTGTFELDSNFIADLTQNGTNPEGCGSLRFSNTKFISHHTQSLPMGYRPNTITGQANINSHLVFHNAPNSTWIVASRPQTYLGGLWVEQSTTIETRKNLFLPGINTVTNEPLGGNYTNYGGVHIFRGNAVLTKSGADTLIINGHQSYAWGAKLVANEGVLRFDTDPWVTDPSIALYPNVTRTNNLSLEALGTGNLLFNNLNARIRALRLSSATAKIQIALNKTLTVRDTIELVSGLFQINIPDGLILAQGDRFQVLNLDSTQFKLFTATLSISDFDGAIAWNTDSLFISGVVKVASGSAVSGIKKTEMKTIIYPNPAAEILFLEGKPILTKSIELIGVQGKTFSLPISCREGSFYEVNLKNLPNGLYYLPLFKTSFVKN